MSDRSNRTDSIAGLVLLLLGLVHLLGCLHHFPPGEIFSGEPLLTSDYSQRFLEASRVAGYLREGSFWGYSTNWMAGFPDGFPGMINNKPLSVVLGAFPTSLHPLVFNVVIFVCLLLVPSLTYVAARGFERDRLAAASAMALFLCAFWGSRLFRLFWRGGRVVFMIGSGVALISVSRLFRLWCEPGNPRRRWAVALWIAGVLWIHPAALIVVLAGGLLIYGATLRSRGWRVGDLVTLVVVTLAMNLPWLASFWGQRNLLDSLYYGIYQGGLYHLWTDLVGEPFHLFRGPREETAVLAALFAAALAVDLGAKERPQLRVFLWGFASMLAVIAYAGTYLGPVATLQPYRFVIPLAGILSIAAAPAAGLVFRGRPPLFAVALLALAALVCADRLRIARHYTDYLGSGLGAIERWVLDELRADVAPGAESTEGRVLLEGDWLAEPVDGHPGRTRVSYSFLGFEHYLPLEFIGADVVGMGLPQRLVSFWRGRWLGRPFTEYEGKSFLETCDRYDITRVVTVREPTKVHLESFRGVARLVASRGPVAIFRIERSPNRLSSGAGNASSDGRRIRFNAPRAGEAVLKYHWVPGLEVSPAAVLRPQPAGRGPAPAFIAVEAPGPGSYSIGLRGMPP